MYNKYNLLTFGNNCAKIFLEVLNNKKYFKPIYEGLLIMKKFSSFLLSGIILFTFVFVSADALSIKSGKDELAQQFDYGEGPVAEGFSIDYRYYSPVTELIEDDEEHTTEKNTTEETTTEETTTGETTTGETTTGETTTGETTTEDTTADDNENDGKDDEEPDVTEEEEPAAKKYPLVVWVHGKSHGYYEGYQIESNDIANWASEEYQARFGEVGGAYIMAVRAPEDKGVSWNEDLVKPLKYAIDDFVLKHSDTIDPTRIYIGGFSLGGMMTFEMAVAYPEMFAAIFPICPYIVVEESEAERFSSVPVWLVSGKRDPLVSYNLKTVKNWNAVVNTTEVRESSRFSTLEKVRNPDGSSAPTAHYSWVAVTGDMFSSTNGSYPYMSTVSATGKTVTLIYPDGMISWLSDFSSEYSLEDIDISDAEKNEASLGFFGTIRAFFARIGHAIRNFFRPVD